MIGKNNENLTIENEDSALDMVDKVLEEAMGYNNNGEPKSAINISLFLLDDVTDEMEDIGDVAVFNPAIKIEHHDQFVQLDLCFKSFSSDELRVIWSLLESYGKELDSFDEIASDKVPVLNIVVVPISFSGKYIISLSNPIFWVLQPENPGEQYCNMIRMLLPEDDIEFLEADDIDFDNIKGSVEAEEAQEEADALKFEEREREKEEYEENRQKMLEDMRKNPRKYE